MKTAEMECALASWFDYRRNLIVPNVYWGMNMHECDLLIVSRAGYVTEVEIKVSKADLKKDAEKRHGHRSRDIKFLYFAVPERLVDACLELAPARAGVLAVRESADDGAVANSYMRPPRVRRVREAEANAAATKVGDDYRYRVARLGALRIWDLKRKLL